MNAQHSSPMPWDRSARTGSAWFPDANPAMETVTGAPATDARPASAPMETTAAPVAPDALPASSVTTRYAGNPSPPGPEGMARPGPGGPDTLGGGT